MVDYIQCTKTTENNMQENEARNILEYDAKDYSEGVLAYNHSSLEIFFKYLDFDLRGKKVLDLGCGDGYELSIIQPKGALIFGLDSCEEMVDLAKQKNPDGIIKVGYLEDIPFPDHTFDVVISKWTFQANSSIDPIYKEIARVLKPGGSFIYLTSHPIRQFFEKKQNGKNYFKKESVKSVFFDGKITESGTSHTFNEYLSPTFFAHFTLEAFGEGWDMGAEKINGDTYPSYFIVKARLKDEGNT
jgi:ubiquinone/menaquinone biosynthesis C-methylase UbiE